MPDPAALRPLLRSSAISVPASLWPPLAASAPSRPSRDRSRSDQDGHSRETPPGPEGVGRASERRQAMTDDLSIIERTDGGPDLNIAEGQAIAAGLGAMIASTASPGPRPGPTARSRHRRMVDVVMASQTKLDGGILIGSLPGEVSETAVEMGRLKRLADQFTRRPAVYSSEALDAVHCFKPAFPKHPTHRTGREQHEVSGFAQLGPVVPQETGLEARGVRCRQKDPAPGSNAREQVCQREPWLPKMLEHLECNDAIERAAIERAVRFPQVGEGTKPFPTQHRDRVRINRNGLGALRLQLQGNAAQSSPKIEDAIAFEGGAMQLTEKRAHVYLWLAGVLGAACLSRIRSRVLPATLIQRVKRLDRRHWALEHETAMAAPGNAGIDPD